MRTHACVREVKGCEAHVRTSVSTRVCACEDAHVRVCMCVSVCVCLWERVCARLRVRARV